jgi:hypothetical protein
MVYTCFEMIRDCRANRREGWLYFVSNCLPVVQKIARHYRTGNDIAAGEILPAACNPQSPLFASLEPVPERLFLAELRQHVLYALDGVAPMPEPEMAIDLETLSAALEPLTLLEKQAVWLEAMRYSPAETARMLHSAAATIEQIREKAGERLRANMDNWRAALLADNGRQLGRAAAVATPECLPAKAFLDLLDGRTTWKGREDLERHVNGCWHCVDHFCRLVEVIDLLRGIQPLKNSEAEPFLRLLGIAPSKPPAWKRLGTLLFGTTRTGA